ncbi:cytochrome P450 2J3-like [Sigmodon hispidus]
MLVTEGSLMTVIWTEIHPRILLLAAVTFLFLTNYLKNRRPKNYPPGPWRLPFVGNLFQLDLKQSHLVIQQLVKKYGNLLSLDFGTIPSVVITGLPLIREAFSHMEQTFMKRPITPLRERVFSNNGLIMSSGQTWKEQRRFTLMTLKNFGLGKNSLELRIQEEARQLVEAIGEEGGQPFDPHLKINNAVSNIICFITFGKRFDYDDDQFQEMLRLLDEATCLEASMMCLLSCIWVLRPLQLVCSVHSVRGRSRDPCRFPQQQELWVWPGAEFSCPLLQSVLGRRREHRSWWWNQKQWELNSPSQARIQALRPAEPSSPLVRVRIRPSESPAVGLLSSLSSGSQ